MKTLLIKFAILGWFIMMAKIVILEGGLEALSR